MRRRHGFTMVEMIVVLVLLGIVGALAVPQFMNRLPEEERNLVDQLRLMLRHARKVAIAQNQQTCVIVQPALFQAVAVYAAAGTACQVGSPLEGPAGGPYVDPIAPIGLAITGSTTVRFNASGQPVSTGNGNTVLAAAQSIVVGSQPALVIAPETGFVYSP